MKNMEVFNKIKTFLQALFIKIEVIIFTRCHNLFSDTVITDQWCNVTDRTGPQWSMFLIELDPMLLGFIKHVLFGILTLNDIDFNQVSYNVHSHQQGPSHAPDDENIIKQIESVFNSDLHIVAIQVIQCLLMLMMHLCSFISES